MGSRDVTDEGSKEGAPYALAASSSGLFRAGSRRRAQRRARACCRCGGSSPPSSLSPALLSSPPPPPEMMCEDTARLSALRAEAEAEEGERATTCGEEHDV